MAHPHQRIPMSGSNNKAQSYNKLYTQNHRSVSRSRSINRPSPPRAKSHGPFPQTHPIYPSRTQSFPSLYWYGSARGTSLDLRPLQASVSSDAGYAYEQYGRISLSLQDICMLGEGGRHKQRKTGRSLLDLSNVTINDSEIDKVSCAPGISCWP